jgi:hypothetical protein
VVVNRTFFKFLALGLNVCFVTNKEKNIYLYYYLLNKKKKIYSSFLTLLEYRLVQLCSFLREQRTKKIKIFLFLSPMPLSHKTTETLTDSSASKTFHE